MTALPDAGRDDFEAAPGESTSGSQKVEVSWSRLASNSCSCARFGPFDLCDGPGTLVVGLLDLRQQPPTEPWAPSDFPGPSLGRATGTARRHSCFATRRSRPPRDSCAGPYSKNGRIRIVPLTDRLREALQASGPGRKEGRGGRARPNRSQPAFTIERIGDLVGYDLPATLGRARRVGSRAISDASRSCCLGMPPWECSPANRPPRRSAAR